MCRLIGYLVFFFFFLIYCFVGCFERECLGICCFKCLVCMCFVFLYLHLFSAIEHISHGRCSRNMLIVIIIIILIILSKES